MFGHFLQSREWEKFEKIEGEETFWLEDENFHALIVLKSTPVGKYLYLPYGPAVRSKEYFKQALDQIKELAQQNNAFFVRIEPTIPVYDTPVQKNGEDDGALVDKGGDAKDSDGGVVVDKTEKQSVEQENVPVVNFDEKTDKKDVVAVDNEKEPEKSRPEEYFTKKEMKAFGLRKSHDLDPAHTWVIDLRGGKDALLSRIDKRRVRYWRTLGNKGITIRTSKNPEEVAILSKLLNQLGEARKFNPQDENHLKNQVKAGFGTLYIAEHEGKPIAAALVHDYDKTRFYMHAAADPEYDKYRVAIGVTIQAMLDAQEQGFTDFDFWGITTSNNPKHPWYGFTKYKKSFDGRQVDYAGDWDLPLNFPKYWAYALLRWVNRLRRKQH